MTHRVAILFGGAMSLLVASELHAQAAAQAPTRRDGIFQQYAPGLLARVNYQADSVGRNRIAFWDLLVGPGKSSDAVRLPGAAVVEVRSGNGRATIDGQASEIRGGVTFVVHQGSSLALTNGRDDLALALRVTLISPGGQ